VSKKKSVKKPEGYQKNTAHDQRLISKQQITSFLASHKVPLGWLEIVQQLGVKSKKEKKYLSGHLSAMLRSGELLFNRKEQYCLVQQSDLEVGVVIGHADGFGFLKRDSGGDDLFIPPHEMRSLLNGDRVVASHGSINRQGKVEARIVEVLERKVKVAKDGQIAMVEIIHYPSSRTQAIGKVIEVMGDHMAPGMEIDMAIRSYDLPHQWSQAALDESLEFPLNVKDVDLSNRKDVRQLPFVTIDGADARDFDDAVFCKKTQKGWKLYVAIADVAHYVRPGTAIDKEAYERGNSVYFPEQVIPMLPEVLSNGLCSLNPHVDRLCMVCEMRIDEQGSVIASSFYQALMYSHARLTYDQVGAIFDKTEPSLLEAHKSLLPQLNDLQRLYQLLKRAADLRGSLEFDTVETRFVFDNSRKIKSIEPLVRHDAHRLIEVCMIAANAATARFLKKHKVPNLLRIHDGPSLERLQKLRDFLSELGLTLRGGESPEPSDYRFLSSQIKDRPDAHLIEMVMLRSMSQAMYSPEQKGHFGLALDLYAHFTSPIRRYPDLLTHRAIKHVISGLPLQDFNYSEPDMVQFGEHSSQCSRRADEATRDVEAWLKCEFMADKVGQVFDGIISSVTSFGLFVELQGLNIDGLVHVTALGDDYYHFDPVKHRLQGERTKQTYRLGDAIRVKLVKVNLDDKKIDLALLEKNNKAKKKPVKRKSRKKR